MPSAINTTSTTEVNKFRYQLFCAKRGEIKSSQLPPCKDCLFMHDLRANYQAAISRRCLQAQPVSPSPLDCGWTSDKESNLVIDWMRFSLVPSSVLQLLSSNCARSCELSNCNCLSNGLRCTEMCKLQTCDNQAPENWRTPRMITTSGFMVLRTHGIRAGQCAV